MANSRYKFEGMSVDQPNAGVGSVDLGSLYNSFRGIDRNAWALQDETIQKDLLAGASPKSGFDKYMNLASIAGAAGDSLASVTFQQKAYSLLNAAQGGSGGRSGRGGGGGSGGSSKSDKQALADAVDNLKNNEQNDVIETIKSVSKQMKSGLMPPDQGLYLMKVAVDSYKFQLQQLKDQYSQYAGKSGFTANLNAIDKELGTGFSTNADDGSPSINKALSENLYGTASNVPDGNYVRQLHDDYDAFTDPSKPIPGPDGKPAGFARAVGQDGAPAQVMVLIPHGTGESPSVGLGQKLKGGVAGYDVIFTSPQEAQKYGFYAVNRATGDGATDTVYVQPTNYDEYQKIIDSAQTQLESKDPPTDAKGKPLSRDQVISNIINQRGFKFNFSLGTFDQKGNSVNRYLELNPDPLGTFNWISNGESVSQGLDKPPTIFGDTTLEQENKKFLQSPFQQDYAPGSTNPTPFNKQPKTVNDLINGAFGLDKINTRGREGVTSMQSPQNNNPFLQSLLGTKTAQAAETPNPNQKQLTDTLRYLGAGSLLNTPEPSSVFYNNPASQLYGRTPQNGLSYLTDPQRALSNSILDKYFPDQSASINTRAEPTNNAFQSIIDSIKAKTQQAQQQAAARKAAVVQMPETPVSRSSNGLVSKAGGGYSNPFAGARSGVQGQVSQAAQNRMDPLQLRNQASMAALNGFKSFANFIKGIF